MVSVFDVAAFILKQLGAITTWKLQKLVYYCQAWSVVWDDAPLFREKIEAWANGPVVRELYNHHRRMFSISSLGKGNVSNLNAEQKETILAVISFYGPKSSQYLSDLTHLEEPWRKARAGVPDRLRSNSEITLESMAEYYGSLEPSEAK